MHPKSAFKLPCVFSSFVFVHSIDHPFHKIRTFRQMTSETFLTSTFCNFSCLKTKMSVIHRLNRQVPSISLMQIPYSKPEIQTCRLVRIFVPIRENTMHSSIQISTSKTSLASQDVVRNERKVFMSTWQRFFKTTPCL